MATIRIHRYEVEKNLLPRVCMKCGAEATVRKRKKFAWHPQWVIALIIFGLLPFAVVALALTKRLTIYAPMCQRHKNHWFWLSFIGLGGFLLLVIFFLGGLGLLGALEKNRRLKDEVFGLFCVGSFFVGLLWLISLAILRHMSIRPTEITDRDITLTNVSPDFVRAFWEEQEYFDEERPRRRRPRRDYYEEDPVGDEEENPRSRRHSHDREPSGGHAIRDEEEFRRPRRRRQEEEDDWEDR